MGRIDDMVWCDGCRVEISLTPIKRKDYEFCCQDCADSLPCWCGIFFGEESMSNKRILWESRYDSHRRRKLRA